MYCCNLDITLLCTPGPVYTEGDVKITKLLLVLSRKIFSFYCVEYLYLVLFQLLTI